MSTWEPAYLKDMAAWIANPNIPMYGRWNAPATNMEGGVDLTSAGGTPVYALASGPIVGVGNFWHGGGSCLYQGGAGCTPGYGVVTTRIDVPGYGQQDLYYQHIQLAPGLAVGQNVQKGQELGTITPGVNEIEMGFNANWGGVWGTNHPGSWVTDPRPLLAALMGQGPGVISGMKTAGAPPASGVVPPNIAGWAQQAGLFVAALLLVGFGSWLLFKQQVEAIGKKALKAGTAIATGGTSVVAEKAAKEA